MKLKALGLLMVLALPASVSADVWSDLASRHETERDELGAKLEKQRLEWSSRNSIPPARAPKSGAKARSAAAFKEFQAMRRQQDKLVRSLDQRQVQEHEALRARETVNPTARAQDFAQAEQQQPASKPEVILDGGGIPREIDFSDGSKRKAAPARLPAGVPARR